MQEKQNNNYLYPLLSVFNEQALNEEEKSLNLLIEEGCFYFITEFLTKNSVKFQFVGFNRTLNEIAYKFKIVSLAKSKYFDCKNMANEVVKMLNEQFSERVEFSAKLVDEEDEQYVVFSSVKYHVQNPSFKDAIKACNPTDYAINATLCADEYGNPCVISLSNKQLILVSAQEIKIKENAVFGALANICCNYSPSQIKFIFTGLPSEHAEYFEGCPHRLFKKNFSKLEQTYPCLQYVNQIVSERIELFNKGDYKDILAYNAVNEEKLPHLLLVIENYKNVTGFYGAYIKKIERLIKNIVALGSQAGVSIIITSQTGGDFFKVELRNVANLKFCFKTDSAWYSYMATSKEGAQHFKSDIQCLEVAKDSKPRTVLAYHFTIEQLKFICDFLRENNSSSFNENDYEQICYQAEKGELSNQNRSLNEEQTLLMEIMRIAFSTNVFTPLMLKGQFTIAFKLIEKALQIAIDKNYLICDDRGVCKLNMTAEQFEQIFGEKV